jgi:hypothetical protein
MLIKKYAFHNFKKMFFLKIKEKKAQKYEKKMKINMYYNTIKNY